MSFAALHFIDGSCIVYCVTVVVSSSGKGFSPGYSRNRLTGVKQSLWPWSIEPARYFHCQQISIISSFFCQLILSAADFSITQFLFWLQILSADFYSQQCLLFVNQFWQQISLVSHKKNCQKMMDKQTNQQSQDPAVLCCPVFLLASIADPHLHTSTVPGANVDT